MPPRIAFHPHALDRMATRGATEDDLRTAIEQGESFEAKHGRLGFRHNLPFDGEWRGKTYATKQVEAYAVEENGSLLVITVIVKYF